MLPLVSKCRPLVIRVLRIIRVSPAVRARMAATLGSLLKASRRNKVLRQGSTEAQVPLTVSLGSKVPRKVSPRNKVLRQGSMEARAPLAANQGSKARRRVSLAATAHTRARMDSRARLRGTRKATRGSKVLRQGSTGAQARTVATTGSLAHLLTVSPDSKALLRAASCPRATHRAGRASDFPL